MPLLKILLPFLFFLTSPTLLAQKNHIPDSLKMLNYQGFINRYHASKKGSDKSEVYLKYYLKKAKLETNPEQMVLAYHFMMYNREGESQLKYLDSMIRTGEKYKDLSLIGYSYWVKGNHYNGKGNYIEGINNYLIADKYVEKTDNDYLKHSIRFQIALIKSVQGFHEEAIPLFIACKNYYKAIDSDSYLNSIYGLSICYNKINKLEESTAYSDFGIKESIRLDASMMEPYFIYSEGVNQYSKKNYLLAIKKISEAIPFIEKEEDTSNLGIAYFYLGKSYFDLKQEEKAIDYFLKVDELFTKTNDIYPDLREGYEILINYYKSNENKDLQLLYIEKLMEVDKVLNANFKHFSKKIIKEYDSTQLTNEKEAIEKRLKSNKLLFAYVIVLFALLLLGIVFVSIRFYNRQKDYKLRYEALVNNPILNKTEKLDTNKLETGIKDVGISEDIVAMLLKELDSFEKNKLFLQKDLTQSKMASIINTNSTYLSKIVNTFKGSNFTGYINTLRIEYVIEELKKNPKMRLYTIKAIAEETGFNTAESFSKAFHTKTGIYPSYFINKLKESEL